jgi:glycosyltransferase EpsE
MDQKKVSIIIACHNGEDYIDMCLASLVSQTYKNIEIVVCDDCSTDNSWNVLKKWKSNHDNIVLERNCENLYAAATRNKCIELAKGDYIAIQDVDDLSENNRIEFLVDVLEHEDIDFVSTSALVFDNNPKRIVSILDLKKEYPQKRDFLFGLPFMHPATIFKKECLLSVGGYRVSKETRRGQDYDLFMRLYAKGYKGKNLSTPLYRFRVDKDNYKRRTFKARLGEIAIRKRGFKEMGLMPLGWLFVYKPLLAHVIMHIRLLFKKVES